MRGNPKTAPTLGTSHAGFMVNDATYTWDSVQSITAFKLDLLTYDIVCLDIEIAPANQILRINEEFSGFEEFSNELEAHFKFPEDWWNSIAHPAFQTNQTRLYLRA